MMTTTGARPAVGLGMRTTKIAAVPQARRAATTTAVFPRGTTTAVFPRGTMTTAAVPRGRVQGTMTVAVRVAVAGLAIPRVTPKPPGAAGRTGTTIALRHAAVRAIMTTAAARRVRAPATMMIAAARVPTTATAA